MELGVNPLGSPGAAASLMVPGAWGMLECLLLHVGASCCAPPHTPRETQHRDIRGDLNHGLLCAPLMTHWVTYQAAHFEWAQGMKGYETNPGCVTSPVSCRPNDLGESVADGDATGMGRAWEDPVRAK